jgi:xylulokinase
VLEGVAFGLRDSFELIRSAGLAEIRQARVSGGGAKSALWRQILADVLDVELVTVTTTEGAAFGAALLAGTGVGIWPSVEAACQHTVQLTGSTRPQPGIAARYEEAYAYYRQLYPALEPIVHGLSKQLE